MFSYSLSFHFECLSKTVMLTLNENILKRFQNGRSNIFNSFLFASMEKCCVCTVHSVCVLFSLKIPFYYTTRKFFDCIKWTEHYCCFFPACHPWRRSMRFFHHVIRMKVEKKKKHVREKLYFLKKGNYSEKISINQALNFDLIGGFLGCLNAQRTFHVIYINVGILLIIR